MDTARTIVELDRHDCLARLRGAAVGRVVFTDRALPAVLPVTFLVDGSSIVVRTSSRSRLARAAHGAVLAFEVDDVQPQARSGWSVVVTGEAVVETDPAERRRLDAMLQAWVPGVTDVFIRIPLSMVTGRQVQGFRDVHATPPTPRTAAAAVEAAAVPG